MKTMNKEELIAFEAGVAKAFEEGKVNTPVHLCGGNEEQLIAIFEEIRDVDYVFSTHRSAYHYLLKGGSAKSLMDEILGRKSGCCRGKGRSMHIYNTSINFYTSAIVGGTCAIATGVALSLKRDYNNLKDRPHVWAFIGDGAEDTGHFFEAARYAQGKALPITFVIEDNDLAVETTKEERWRKFAPVVGQNIIRYSYVRKYPHVGIGHHVSM